LSSISIIVAASTNNAIGKNNQLLWHLPTDLKFFKNTTWAMPVIMGRKTFESVNKPLPGRFNIVVTRQGNWKADGVIIATDLQNALVKAAETNCKEVFIIGGGEIYKQAIDFINEIYLTRVHTVIEDADTFFDTIDANTWQLVSTQDFVSDDKHKYAYSFEKWERKYN
jgi:dihydrofolate reductase